MSLKRLVLPLILLVAGVCALAVSFASAQTKDPYEFRLGEDITAKATDVTIEPRWRGVAEDRFEYDIFVNTTRNGTASGAAESISSFRRTEDWTVLATLTARENELEGRKDLLLALAYDRINFLIDNGRGRYAGYIGPSSGDGASAKFQEVLPDGTRNDVTNIPGWPGIGASTVETNRNMQAGFNSASAWFSINDQGRLYDEQHFADLGTAAEQRQYPGALVDPVHLALGLGVEFTQGAKLKIGQTTEIVRRFPLGMIPGATAQYRFTYKLEKLYGKVEEPAAARFIFTAVPIVAKQEVKIGDLTATFDAPEIKNGTLLLDLTKGIAVDVTWSYSLQGTITQPADKLASKFSTDTDYRASLRKKPKKAE